jgi:hypothetical protein
MTALPKLQSMAIWEWRVSVIRVRREKMIS